MNKQVQNLEKASNGICGNCDISKRILQQASKYYYSRPVKPIDMQLIL